MFGRRRERARVQMWADVLVAAAREVHYDGPIDVDLDRRIVVFASRDEFDLGALLDESERLTEPQLRGKVEARASWMAKRQFVIPDDWQTDDHALMVSIRSTLFKAQGGYGGSVAEELARLARIIGRSDGDELLGRAADLHTTDARAKDVLADRLLVAAAIRAELGQHDDARQLAEDYRTLVGDVGEVGDWSGATLEQNVIAALWTGGRFAVAELAPRVRSGESDRVDILVSAAAAAEAGDEDGFGVELDRARRWLARDRTAGYRYSHNSTLPLEVMIEILERWSPSERAAEPRQPARHSAAVLAEVAAPGARRVRWSGDIAVAEGDATSIGVDLADGSVADVPDGPDRVEGVDDQVAITVEEGRLVVARGGDRIVLDSELDEGLGALEAVFCADRIVVFGEFGPVLVFGLDGIGQHRLLGHENDPNLGVSGRGDRLATWAAGGRVVVWDLGRGMIVQAIDIDAWPERAALDESGEFVAVQHPDAGWSVWSVDSGDRLDPPAATSAVWHPTEPVLAWLEGDVLLLVRCD